MSEELGGKNECVSVGQTAASPPMFEGLKCSENALNIVCSYCKMNGNTLEGLLKAGLLD